MSKKRKQSSSAPESSDRSPKRQRSTLEHGFAGLSLAASVEEDPIPIDVEPPPRPVSPTVPDIKMKSSSWYEPEPDRIIITDLNSSSDEEDADASPDPLTISPALLQRLNLRAREAKLAPPQPPQSQALVLFRPLSHAPKQPDAGEAQNSKRDDADAMDVET
ncbi:hypothetical protein C8J57DRAFT_1496131 [Mycena rebaudengoi]|nr:hypothetical protein C8J57DRAFT_1496131 [Mycena rebaudengoi]